MQNLVFFFASTHIHICLDIYIHMFHLPSQKNIFPLSHKMFWNLLTNKQTNTIPIFGYRVIVVFLLPLF